MEEEHDDERELLELIDYSYSLMEFEPGGEPKWDELFGCYHENAVMALRVFPDDDGVSVMTMPEYRVRQMEGGHTDEGYSEEPVSRTVNIVGDVAVVVQRFLMHFGNEEGVPAVDIITAAKQDGAWVLTSCTSDMER